jgi:N-acetyl-gamma-glutamyl-phosphate reductase
LKEAAYGLPELNREAIRKARVVGNPGCYPTTMQLGFAPLLKAGVIDASPDRRLQVGVSGAGRKAN